MIVFGYIVLAAMGLIVLAIGASVIAYELDCARLSRRQADAPTPLRTSPSRADDTPAWGEAA